VPAIVIALDLAFDFRPEVKIVLTALAIIAGASPLLPGKQRKAGGLASYGIGLMATCALLSVVTVPLSVENPGARGRTTAVHRARRGGDAGVEDDSRAARRSA